MPITLLVVDDHPMIREGIRMFLGHDQEIVIVGEAADGAEAVRLAGLLRPDVVLMDLLMAGMDGIAATKMIRSELPEVEVVAFTSTLDDLAVVGAIRAGAIGFVVKDSSGDTLRNAIVAAANGQVQIDPRAASRLVREVQAPGNPEPLTERETEVLELLSNGMSNKEMAQALGIGEKTVKSHVSSILGKLGVSSRTQAALHAIRIGLGTPLSGQAGQ